MLGHLSVVQLLQFYTKHGSEESKVTNRTKEIEDETGICPSKKDGSVMTIACVLWCV